MRPKILLTISIIGAACLAFTSGRLALAQSAALDTAAMGASNLKAGS